MPFIEVVRAALRYGGPSGMLAVEDCSLEIEEGEFAVLVGPSGCGKSSLLKLLSGLQPTSSGTVSIAGRMVRGTQQGVGMAFQNATLLPWRSTLDNVLLPLEVAAAYRRSFRARRRQHVERANELLHLVGLHEFKDQAPYELSGGMQQRANLARALIHEPEILLLDEPFAALDAFTREELWGVLQELWTRQRFTVALVTHDLREAVYLADRVHVVSNRPGRIILTKPIELPRPRTLDGTFSPEFVNLVHELREAISRLGGARTAPVGDARPASSRRHPGELVG